MRRPSTPSMRRARSFRARRAWAISPSRTAFRAPPSTSLRRRGHDIELRDGWSLGRVSAAAKDGPLLKAAANPRHMQGYAIGR